MTMTCADFELRLYDDDCGAALREGRAAPPDVAAHLVTCVACRETWNEAEVATRAIREALVQPLPAGLRTSLHAIPRRERARPWAAHAHLVFRALAAGALAAACVAAVSPAAVPWHLAVFGTVVSGTLATVHGQRAGLGGLMRRFLVHAGSMSGGFWRLRALPVRRGP